MRKKPRSSRRTARRARARGRGRRARGRARRARAARQRTGEPEHVVELLAVAPLAPARVVEVLPAARGVDAGGLDVAAGIRADPDVLPGRRDHELVDPREDLGVRDGLPVLVEVAEPRPWRRGGFPGRGVRPPEPDPGDAPGRRATRGATPFPALAILRAGLGARRALGRRPVALGRRAVALALRGRAALGLGLGLLVADRVQSGLQRGHEVRDRAPRPPRSGWTTISLPSALRSIIARTCSRYVSWYLSARIGGQRVDQLLAIRPRGRRLVVAHGLEVVDRAAGRRPRRRR